MTDEEYKRCLEMTDEELREEIKNSYRVLVKKFHPDAPHNRTRREWATEIMQKINRVYDMVRQ
jgi:DnaJ-class molecular chaperone